MLNPYRGLHRSCKIIFTFDQFRQRETSILCYDKDVPARIGDPLRAFDCEQIVDLHAKMPKLLQSKFCKIKHVSLQCLPEPASMSPGLKNGAVRQAAVKNLV